MCWKSHRLNFLNILGIRRIIAEVSSQMGVLTGPEIIADIAPSRSRIGPKAAISGKSKMADRKAVFLLSAAPEAAIRGRSPSMLLN